MQAGGGERSCAATNLHIAEKLLLADDAPSASQLLQSVAQIYRRDGWDALLASSLASLRECARLGGSHAEHTAASLQLGCLLSEGAPTPERAAVLATALTALEAHEGEPLSVPGAACAVAGWAHAVQPGGTLQFHAAVRVHAHLPLEVESCVLEAELGGAPLALALQPRAAAAPTGWRVFSSTLAAPEAAATLRARVLQLRLGRCVAVALSLADAFDADPVAPSDPLALGALHVARCGGVPGLHSVAVACAPSTVSLSLAAPRSALAGQRALFTLRVKAGRDGCAGCLLRLALPGGCAAWDKATAAPLPLSPAWLALPDVPPDGEHTLQLVACWAEPREGGAATAELTHGTPHGPARCEAATEAPPVRAPFSLTADYWGAWLRHSLQLEGAMGGAAAALPVGQPCLLAAHLRAEGALTLCALSLEPSPGCEATACPVWARGRVHTMQPGDALLQHATLTATQPQPLLSPCALVACWQPEGGDPGAPCVVTRLALPAVSVGSQPPPLVAQLTSPSTGAAGCPMVVCVALHNSTTCVQEVALSVSDAPGLVFAGDRVTALSVLPLSTSTLLLTVVAHAPGWQALPHVAVTSRRYGARLDIAAPLCFFAAV